MSAGVLMVVLDTTVVNIALPSIKTDLGFSDAGLTWVVNAFLLGLAGFRLLGGRLGDLLGHRKVFLHGIQFFTLASLGCALADSPAALVIARAVQGIAGTAVIATAFALIANLFPEEALRAKAIGVYGSVCSAGGIVGLILGGGLTSALGWHWVFLINLPIGLAVYWLCRTSLPDEGSPKVATVPDSAGAVTVTASLLLAVYGIIESNGAGWLSIRTVGLLSAAVSLATLFLMIEARVAEPLVPPRMFRNRNLTICIITSLLYAVAGSSWLFTSLYLQLVLGYSPLQVSVAFLPSNLIFVIVSLKLAATLVVRFGTKPPMVVGLLLMACGIGLLARVPVPGNVLVDAVPGTLLLALGNGIAVNPLALAAIRKVAATETGLVSGIVGTATLIGNSLGLAILATAASGRTHSLLTSGMTASHALSDGYRVAFFLGAVSTLAAATIAATLLEIDDGQTTGDAQRARADESIP